MEGMKGHTCISSLNRKTVRAYQLKISKGSYHIENIRLICRANQWTCFYMKLTSVTKEVSTW